MQVLFTTKKLKKLIEQNPEKEYGQQCARQLRKRLLQLEAAETLEELRYQSGRFHELKGDRKGQWACDLAHPYRLVFTPTDPIAVDSNGHKPPQAALAAVVIIEIVDYH